MSMREEAGRRFARFATNLAVRWPATWRLWRRPMRAMFDSIAPHWDRDRDPEAFAPLAAALEKIDAPGRALDLGTGTGTAALAVANRFPEAEVTGTDLAPAMLAEARRKTPPELAPRVRFEEGDAEGLPYPDEWFELVTLANMLPFFDELARVTAPGGWVVFSWSRGAETPIYVPSDVLRKELERRGFTDFSEIAAGKGTAFVARKRPEE